MSNADWNGFKVVTKLFFALGLAGWIVAGVFAWHLMRLESNPAEAARATPTKADAGIPAALPAEKSISFHWSELESANYPVFIANLRRIGCPEQTIRDIIISDVCQLFSVEWKKRFVSIKTDYWDPEYGHGPINSEHLMAAAMNLKNSLETTVRDLLGVDLLKEVQKYVDIGSIRPDKEYLLATFLPYAKASPVAQVLEKYASLLESIRTQPHLTRDAALQTKNVMEQERRDLLAWIDPAQLEQVEWRFSSLAQDVRDKMSGFRLTETEFQRIYEARRQSQERFYRAIENAPDSLPADEVVALSEQNLITESTLRELLGTARFADYERSQDFRYQELERFGSKNTLSAEQIQQTYEACRRTESTIQDIRDNPNLDSDARDEMIKAQKESASRLLRQILGDEMYLKVKRETSISN